MRFKYQTPTGIHDLCGEDQKYLDFLYTKAKEILEFYGFEKIELPILEREELFKRSVGEATDIVEKEMYTLTTLGGEKLVLRPEATASIVRAYIQHGMHTLPQPVKIWTFGPMYRYERPQHGRYRQFYQLDFEILGSDSPSADTQVIFLTFTILKELKLKNLKILINSIGDSCCRPYYKKQLKTFFRPYLESLCKDCQRRFEKNPLRILDCKNQACREIIDLAPQSVDNLCQDCKTHFKRVLEILDNLDLPYLLDPYLVRGLDYYTKTVFEIVISKENLSLGGGGRYDKLVKLLGGPDTPAVGVALGAERIITELKEEKIKVKGMPDPKVFVAKVGDLAQAKALLLLEELRKAKVPVRESLGKDSLRAQLDLANKLKVKWVVILGQKEVIKDRAILRDMKKGTQKEVKISDLVGILKKLALN